MVAAVCRRHPRCLGYSRACATGLGFGMAGDLADADAVAAVEPADGTDDRESHRAAHAAACRDINGVDFRIPLDGALGRCTRDRSIAAAGGSVPNLDRHGLAYVPCGIEAAQP